MEISKASADCMGAIRITDKIGPIKNSIGFGFVQEIDNAVGQTPAMLEREYNPGWFRFTAEDDGELLLTIKSVVVNDDYNFGLYRSEGPWFCQSFKYEQFPNPVRANLSAADESTGTTGLSSDGAEETADAASHNAFCKPLKVKRGEDFYLIIDSRTRPQSGYTIEIAYRQATNE